MELARNKDVKSLPSALVCLVELRKVCYWKIILQIGPKKKKKNERQRENPNSFEMISNSFLGLKSRAMILQLWNSFFYPIFAALHGRMIEGKETTKTWYYGQKNRSVFMYHVCIHFHYFHSFSFIFSCWIWIMDWSLILKNWSRHFMG